MEVDIVALRAQRLDLLSVDYDVGIDLYSRPFLVMADLSASRVCDSRERSYVIMSYHCTGETAGKVDCGRGNIH